MMEDLSEVRITELATHQCPSGQVDTCTVQKDFLKSEDPSVLFVYEDLDAIDRPAPPTKMSFLNLVKQIHGQNKCCAFLRN